MLTSKLAFRKEVKHIFLRCPEPRILKRGFLGNTWLNTSIVTCTGVRVTIITILNRIIGFIDPYFVQLHLITIIIALLPIITLSSSPLHTHLDSQSPLVVSWQLISAQKLLVLQITMKSSCHFFQSPWNADQILILQTLMVLDSVLHDTNLFSINLLNLFPPVSPIRFLATDL
jgi:hypothetical protein